MLFVLSVRLEEEEEEEEEVFPFPLGIVEQSMNNQTMSLVKVIQPTKMVLVEHGTEELKRYPPT